MNTLVVIGWLGSKTCYLNVPRHEAIRRYVRDNDYEPTEDMITEFTFDDTFSAYDAYQ